MTVKNAKLLALAHATGLVRVRTGRTVELRGMLESAGRNPHPLSKIQSSNAYHVLTPTEMTHDEQ